MQGDITGGEKASSDEQKQTSGIFLTDDKGDGL